MLELNSLMTQLSSLPLPKLRDVADADYGLVKSDTKGMDKSELLDQIESIEQSNCFK